MPTSFALRATTKSWRAANRAGAISCGASHSRVKSACKPTHSPTCNSPNHRRRPSRDGPPRSQHCVLSPSRQDTKARLRGTRIYTKREGVRRSATDYIKKGNAPGGPSLRDGHSHFSHRIKQIGSARGRGMGGDRKVDCSTPFLFRRGATEPPLVAPRFVVARQRKTHICQYMRNAQMPSICLSLFEVVRVPD